MSENAFPPRPDEEAILLHRLSAAERETLREKLPALARSILISVQLAVDTAEEPVGALGHLVFARAAIAAIVDPLLAKIRQR
jgi:hypothetical protein